MASYYELQIKCSAEKKNIIEKILGKSDREFETNWYLIIEEGSPEFPAALEHFIKIIKKNLIELNDLKIESNDISFWFMYEYEEQCNMEFHPEVTKKIGELGIVLCISCWSK